MTKLYNENLLCMEYFLPDSSEVLHRANGPARIWNEGDFEWYLFGNIHRYYGPPTCFAGTTEFYPHWAIHGEWK